MHPLVPGHQYKLYNFEPDKELETGEKFTSAQILNFIHKESKEGSTTNEYETIHNGTTNEEVLEVLIDRLIYLQNEHQGGKFKCKENACAITHLEEALHWLESRTKKRIAREVEGKHVV